MSCSMSWPHFPGWLLTSFMHERDALSVPTQWIPTDITFANYLTFFDPSGTRAIVGSRAAEQTLPSMVNSLIAASATALINVVLGTLAGYSLARFRFRGQPCSLCTWAHGWCRVSLSSFRCI